MTALVTGASSGIGKELLPLLAADKHDLVLVARRAEVLAAQKTQLEREHGIRVHAIPLDLSSPGAAERLFARTQSLGLTIDTLVNNAGFGLAGAFATQPLPKLKEMVFLNVNALFELTRLYVEGMCERKSGRILQLASTAAFQPGPGMAVYYATKAFVLSLSEALDYELKGSGVHVTTLCPGPTASEFMDVAGYKASKLVQAQTMTSAEVARIGYRALVRGDGLVVAGVKNRIGSVLSQLAPRGVVIDAAARLMRTRST